MQGFTHSRLTLLQRKANFDVKIKKKNSMDREIQVKGTGLRCMFEGYVKDNNYVRFETRSYH